MTPKFDPQLTVAQRASLLRACHCEEKVLLGQIEFCRDQYAQGVVGAEAKLRLKEAELEMLRSAVRALWLA